MGVRQDIVRERLDTEQGRSQTRSHLTGDLGLPELSLALGVEEPVAREWAVEYQARELEQRFADAVYPVLGAAEPVFTIARRACSVPFVYLHDAEMFWVTLSRQMGQLAAAGHPLRQFTDIADASCELLAPRTPRSEWPTAISAALAQYAAGRTEAIAQVSIPRARALRGQAAEVIWACAPQTKDAAASRGLAEAVAYMEPTLDRTRTAVTELEALLGPKQGRG